jgi:hypothetical protein
VGTRLLPLGAALILVAGVGVHQGLKPSAADGGLAGQMLAAAIVPAGAVRVCRLPRTAFAQPSEDSRRRQKAASAGPRNSTSAWPPFPAG